MVGAPERPAYSLVDHFGKAVSEADFRGSPVLVYFGFTSCRVVCPRALAKLSDSLEILETRGVQAIRPLYISVDPERDSPGTMRAFLESHYPRFLGLTGSAPQIEAARSAFRVFARKRPDPDDPMGYQIAHTAIAYLLGKEGEYLEHYPDTIDAQEIARRISARLD